MARRGRRRSGEGIYHPSRRSLPRPLILDLLDAVYPSNRDERPRSTQVRGYGGGYLPHAQRRAATSYTRLMADWNRPLPRAPSMQIIGAPRRQAGSPKNHFLKALLLRPHIVGSSIPTMPGDRKTEPVKRPRRVTQCTQRQDRREVLHALGVAGRRGSAPGRRGRYRRTLMSNFSCGG